MYVLAYYYIVNIQKGKYKRQIFCITMGVRLPTNRKQNLCYSSSLQPKLLW